MLSFNQAEQIAKSWVHIRSDGSCDIVQGQTLAKPYGWVFFWETREFLATRNEDLVLVGNSPFIVSIHGEIRILGTARPVEEYLARYELSLPSPLRPLPPHQATTRIPCDITLNLVVLRSAGLARSALFYGKLGLEFVRHRHGDGPEHLSAELSSGVFELYPLSSGGASTLGTRIGFRVPSVDAAIKALGENPGVIIAAVSDSEWGRRAVVADPDGHRVELLQS